MRAARRAHVGTQRGTLRRCGRGRFLPDEEGDRHRPSEAMDRRVLTPLGGGSPPTPAPSKGGGADREKEGEPRKEKRGETERERGREGPMKHV